MPSSVADLFVLRETVARIQGETTWSRVAAPEGAASAVALGDGGFAFDAVLGGGLRRGALHEIMAMSPRDAAAASSFAIALAVRCAGEGALIWIVDDRAAWETGLPYRPGLGCHGLAADRLVLVKTRDVAMTLWATEEALRAGARVVVTELWRARSYDLAASRRLLLAARRRGATNLLVHVGLSETDEVSSAADTRFAVAAHPSEHRPSAGHRMPVPGLPGFAVRVTKLRAGAADARNGHDRDAVHALAWDGQARRFRLGSRNEDHPARTRSDVA